MNGTHDLTMFLTVAKSNGKEGRVICVRTRDGAKTWTMEAFVGPEPEGRDYAIMPSSVRLSKGRILTMVRYRKFIDAYVSDDDGRTWQHLNRPAPATGGNPPSLVRLEDGRLALTYGYRLKPYGICARLSDGRGTDLGRRDRPPGRRGSLGPRLHADGSAPGRKDGDGVLLQPGR